jgi:hypothetical protein
VNVQKERKVLEMQLYNVYGDKIGKTVLNKKETISKMKSNTLRLIDSLSFNYHQEWINIFGNTMPYYANYWDSAKQEDHIGYIPGYIYMIKNIKTNMAYIGQTENLIQRKSKHLSDLKTINHDNADMQVDAILYGLNNFLFGIVEFFVPREKLLEKEKKWIKYFGTEYPEGYNAPYDDRIDYNQRDAKNFIATFIEIKNIREEKINNSFTWNEKFEYKLHRGREYYGENKK